MNLYRTLFLFLAFTVSTTVFVYSQTEQQNFDFGKGRFTTIEGNRIDFSSISLANEVFTYETKTSSSSHTIDIGSVSVVEVQNGSYAIEGGVGGAIFGLVGSALFVETSGPTGSDAWNDSEKRRIISYSTAGSAAFGFLMGYMFKKYDTVYSSSSHSAGIGIIELPIDIAGTRDAVGLRMNYYF